MKTTNATRGVLLALLLLSLAALACAQEVSKETKEGSENAERDEFRWVSMCWKQKMRGCLLECEERKVWLIPETFRHLILRLFWPETIIEEETNKEVEREGFGLPVNPPTNNETTPIDWLKIEYPSLDILDEMCGANCQGFVSWMCSETNLMTGGSKVFKFGGRWPFRPLWFVVEPASALLSLFTSFVQIYFLLYYFRLFRSFNQKTGGRYGKEVKPILWLLNTGLWIITMWSASLFHTFDIMITERLDYFAMFVGLMVDSINTLVHVFSIRSYGATAAIAFPFVAFGAHHIHFMSTVKFDYGYHVKVCMIIVAVSTTIWCLWIARNRHRSGIRSMVISVFCIPLFALFELFDFPPLWGVFDGHSLWHLTLNVIFYFTSFFVALDMEFFYHTLVDEMKRESKTVDVVDNHKNDDDDDVIAKESKR